MAVILKVFHRLIFVCFRTLSYWHSGRKIEILGNSQPFSQSKPSDVRIPGILPVLRHLHRYSAVIAFPSERSLILESFSPHGNDREVSDNVFRELLLL